jgi:multidrug efflux system outer membrane protein
LMLKSQLGIAKSNLELNNNTLEILKLQYDAGEITSLAVQQVQLQKLKAETFIPQIEKEYLQEEVYLNSLLGRFPETINIDFWIEEIQPETLYGAGVPLELLNNRPDIAASEYVLMAAYARAGIAQAMKYPSVTLNASVGLDAMFFQDMFNPLNSGLLWLSGSILQPIFQQGKLRANHNISLLQIEKAQLDFQQKMITAVGEVSNALIAVEKLKEEYRIGSERLEIAQQSVRSALLLFKSGLANYLEVLTAQSNALDSELNLANVKMKILMANVELYRSLGGGWE